MKKLNNKGFTLVEVLAVLVILSAIMGIALPSITSSMERNKDKQNEHKKEMLASFAEIYVANHRNSLYNWMENRAVTSDMEPEDKYICYIKVSELRKEGILSNDVDKDSNGAEMNGYIYFNKTQNLFVYSDDEDVDDGIEFDVEGETVSLTTDDECGLN